MFWKVPGFSQVRMGGTLTNRSLCDRQLHLLTGFAVQTKPSPVEQILDKEEFTLEELLDEDDTIQECKSLNSRLVAL
eukprot:351532-Chlamydomonas_euryale.AAC.3